MASLIQDKDLSDLEKLVFLIDGELLTPKRAYLREIVSDVCNIDKKRIEIKAGPHFDKSYPLVNLADELAHYLFRKCSPEQLSNDPHQKYFIK